MAGRRKRREHQAALGAAKDLSARAGRAFDIPAPSAAPTSPRQRMPSGYGEPQGKDAPSMGTPHGNPNKGIDIFRRGDMEVPKSSSQVTRTPLWYRDIQDRRDRVGSQTLSSTANIPSKR